MLLVVGDVPVDSEAPVGLHRSQDLLAQSFKGAHRDKVCVRGLSVHACCGRVHCT
jgi:hypothetical protein